MSNTLKNEFRIRNTKTKSWVEPNGNPTQPQRILLDVNTGELIQYDVLSNTMMFLDKETNIISRNTHIRDVNGDEIFEGDVVSIKIRHLKTISSVTYSHRARTFCVCGVIANTPLSGFTPDQLKIVDNIYEDKQSDEYI